MGDPLRRRVPRHPLQVPCAFRGLRQKSTQARLPSFLLSRSLHDAAGFAFAADRPFAPPRFDHGLSTEAGGFATGDPGVSPDRTFTGWLSGACARLRHVRSFAFMASELLDERRSTLC